MIYWLTPTLLLVSLLPWLLLLAAVTWTQRHTAQLALQDHSQPKTGWPSLTLVSPAKDEASQLPGSLQSLLALDYPNLQIVAVNDRSTDNTGDKLDQLALQDSRLKVVHISTLPPNWLGKVHALHQGTQHATSDWLLFADADVHYATHTLKRAIRYAIDNELDLLTVFPQVEPIGPLGDIAYLGLGAPFAAGNQLWNVRNPQSPRATGIGCFLLLKRQTLEHTEGLQWLRLEVADDVGLGLLIKRHGGKLDLVNGKGALRLRWYDSYPQMAQRMQKNWFGIIGRYSPVRCSLFALASISLGLSPLYAALQPNTLNLSLAALILLAQTLTGFVFTTWAGWPRYPVLFTGPGVALQGLACLRAALIGARKGGVQWRGDHYPSEQLRQHQRVHW